MDQFGALQQVRRQRPQWFLRRNIISANRKVNILQSIRLKPARTVLRVGALDLPHNTRSGHPADLREPPVIDSKHTI